MKEIWLESQGTILECRYKSPLLNALTLGQTKKKYLITFSFEANGEVYTCEYLSAKALPQGERVPVRYSAGNPDENNLTIQNKSGKNPLLLPVLVGILILLIIWYVRLHNQH